MREDYSADGDGWDYFPHDHARSRAYRWGEDGLLGICDREGRLCFALALWNGRDPILKERLFGLTGPEGNHGEDVKESYFYLDSTPTHSYMKALYKYPQAEFPYARLVEENPAARQGTTRVRARRHRRLRRRPLLRRLRRVRQGLARRHPHPDHRRQPRAGAARRSTCCRRSGSATPGRGAARARATGPSPASRRTVPAHSSRTTPTLGRFRFASRREARRARPSSSSPRTRRTSSASSARPTTPPRTSRTPSTTTSSHGRADAVNPARTGTKAAARYRLDVPAGGETRRAAAALRRRRAPPPDLRSGPGFDAIFRRAAARRPTPSTRPAFRRGSLTRRSASRARPTPACSGRSSSITTS